MDKDANFYSVKKQGDYFNFVKIANDDMGEVYENLAKAYDEIDKIAAKMSCMI